MSDQPSELDAWVNKFLDQVYGSDVVENAFASPTGRLTKGQAKAAIKAELAQQAAAARMLGANDIIGLADARTYHPLAPDHDNYIIKCYVVDEYFAALTPKPTEGEDRERN